MAHASWLENMELLEALNSVLPKVIGWAEEQEKHILEQGRPLSAAELKDARVMGVAQAGQVRVLAVAQIPSPRDAIVRALSAKAGLNMLGGEGMTLGHGIYVHSGVARQRSLVVHELAHVAQYERLGGIEPFLRQYLTECLTCGYFDSPLEKEAVEWTRQLTT